MKSSFAVAVLTLFVGTLAFGESPQAAPVLTTIVVTPPSANLLTLGMTQQFTANGRDQFGNPYPLGAVTWSATAGSITQTGLYTAGSFAGKFTVTATSGSVSGTATVATGSPVLSSVTMSPPWVKVGGPGAMIIFMAYGFDQYGNSFTALFTWTASAGTLAPVGLNQCTYTSPKIPGTHTLTATSAGRSATATIYMSDPVFSEISVTPSLLSLLPGATQQFTAQGLDQYGTPVPAILTWSASGGSITSTGFFTAPLIAGVYTITAASGLIKGTATAVVGQSTTIVNNGAPGKRIDVVFVPQGYSNAELTTTFVTDCQSGVDQFRNRSPFKEYFPYFNFHRVMFNPIEAPDVDVEVILINASGRSSATLGGTRTWVYRTQIVHALIHECGHCMNSMLNDEYVEAGYNQTYTGPEQITGNTTISLTNPKWNHWIDATTPRPTLPSYVFPAGSTMIGLFEGCAFAYTKGIYRPAYNCHMRTAGSTPFDAVCTEIVTRSYYTYPEVATYDAATPPAGNVDVSGTSTSFSVVPKAPTDHPLTITWFVDGVVRQNGGASFSVLTSDLVNASTLVECEIKDVTSKVRLDSQNVMKDRVSWTLRRALNSITVTPSSVKLPPGGTRQFTAQGYDVFMKPVAATYSWTATGGTITQTGLYTAPSTTGTYTVRATSGIVVGIATVTVEVPRLTSIAVTPGSVLVAPGYHRRFWAEGRDQFGSPFPIGAVTWSASAGTVDSTGRYTAPTSTGTFTITARYSTLSGTASALVHTSTKRGDMNGDGNLTGSDIVLLQNWVFLGTGKPAYRENFDCNDDLLATGADIVMELNAVFLGQELPPVPPGGTPLDE